MKPLKSRFIVLHLCRRDTGKVDRVEKFLDSRPAEKVAADLNVLLAALDSPYLYRVPNPNEAA